MCRTPVAGCEPRRGIRPSRPRRRFRSRAACRRPARVRAARRRLRVGKAAGGLRQADEHGEVREGRRAREAGERHVGAVGEVARGDQRHAEGEDVAPDRLATANRRREDDAAAGAQKAGERIREGAGLHRGVGTAVIPCRRVMAAVRPAEVGGDGDVRRATRHRFRVAAGHGDGRGGLVRRSERRRDAGHNEERPGLGPFPEVAVGLQRGVRAGKEDAVDGHATGGPGELDVLRFARGEGDGLRLARPACLRLAQVGRAREDLHLDRLRGEVLDRHRIAAGGCARRHDVQVRVGLLRAEERAAAVVRELAPGARRRSRRRAVRVPHRGRERIAGDGLAALPVVDEKLDFMPARFVGRETPRRDPFVVARAGSAGVALRPRNRAVDQDGRPVVEVAAEHIRRPGLHPHLAVVDVAVVVLPVPRLPADGVHAARAGVARDVAHERRERPVPGGRRVGVLVEARNGLGVVEPEPPLPEAGAVDGRLRREGEGQEENQ